MPNSVSVKESPTDLSTPSVSASSPRNGSGRARLFWMFLVLLAIAFAAPLSKTFWFATRSEYNSHILLIPIVSAYLIYQRRQSFGVAVARPSYLLGSLLAVIGLAALGYFLYLNVPSSVGKYHTLVMLSFLSLAVSGAAYLLGADVLRQFLFPVAFLIFAIPLPHTILVRLEILLQHASAEAAYWMLTLANVPMLRDGVDFRLPGIPIRVAEECSGFNSSFVLFVVALLAGHLFLRKTRNKWILAVAVIPLAILRNGFRITVISMLCVYVGPHMIDSPIHRKGGPVFFALSMIPFVAMIWFLRKREAKSKDRHDDVKKT